ncbi:MAG: type II toxin-antitoxin system VapC family toxin [Actinomycetota bacterium]
MSPIPARCVVDASVAVKWLVDEDEPDLEPARSLLDARHRHATDVLMLDLTFYEVGNALRRRLASEPEGIVPLILALFDLDVGVIPLDDSLAALAAVVAAEHDLTYHDAAYLAAARAADAVLITADRRLAGAAGDWGMTPAGLA